MKLSVNNNFSFPKYNILNLKNNKYAVLSNVSSSWFITNKIGLEILKLYEQIKAKDGNAIRIFCTKYNLTKEEFLNDYESFLNNIKDIGFFYNENSHHLKFNKIEIKHMYLEVTDRCNLRCLHCYLEKRHKSYNSLNINKIKNLIMVFEEMGGECITVSGGEIFLYDIWEEVLSFLSKRNLDVAIFTNGTLLNKSMIKKLTNYNIKTIGLSIHGIKKSDCTIRGENAFNKSLEALNLFLKMGLIDKVCLSLTPVSINKNDLDCYLSFAKDYGIKRINISLFEPRGNGLRNYELLNLTPEEKIILIEKIYNCALKYRDSIQIDFTDIRNILSKFASNKPETEKHPFWQGVHVTAKGDVFLSVLCYIEKYKIGNINNNSIEKIFTSPKLSDFILEVLSRKYKIPLCSKCIWKYFCGGGNPTTTFFEYGSIYHPTPYCNAFQNIFPKLLDQISILWS